MPLLWAATTAALLVVALLGAAFPVHADVRRFTPVPAKSEVSFAASYPFGNFTGRTQDITGEVHANLLDLRSGVTGVVRVKAASLRTGDDGRDRDMRRTLAADRYPEIRFTVERIEASFPSVADRSDVLVTINGLMSIRGVERAMIFPGRARVRDDKLWVRGEAELRMSDFGVRPPSRFFLDVKDTVLVSFDLTLAPD
jgi:polyisoprenoid-binding protein YceI